LECETPVINLGRQRSIFYFYCGRIFFFILFFCRQVHIMNQDLIVTVEQRVRNLFEGEGTGHDWFHIDRVRKNALYLGKAEKANLQVVELAALLHDIADHKFNNHDLSVGPRMAKTILLQSGADNDMAERVAVIVSEVSYKGSGVGTPVSSVESAVVQDADRLDAIGAIGIARAFAYGGSKYREIYNPDKRPRGHDDFMSYATDEGTTINHFYEKLLLLKDRMQTQTGQSLAQERHDFMVSFLERFYREWEGAV
jgi:uncharacterized protein